MKIKKKKLKKLYDYLKLIFFSTHFFSRSFGFEPIILQEYMNKRKKEREISRFGMGNWIRMWSVDFICVFY